LPLAYFSMWTLRLGGWLPDLEHCARCGRELADEAAYTSPGHPGLVCASCRLPGMRVISPAARASARRIVAERLDRLTDGSLPEAAIAEVLGYSLDLIEHHIERKLASRKMLETVP
jgi:DNA repair protein RecO (recombination protein O)